MLPVGSYTAVATVENEGYTWCKFFIPNSSIERYAAVYKDISYISEPTDYKKLYEEELAKNKALEEKHAALLAENIVLTTELGKANESLEEIKGAIKTLIKYGG